jgi:hypothetical protein
MAICVTGRITNTFAQTASNFRDVFLQSLAPRFDYDIFFHVKADTEILNSMTKAMLESLHPKSLSIYSEMEPPVAGWDTHWAFIAWLQRHQWQGCWDKVLEVERQQLVAYDFVVRTRPDLLYDAAYYKPDMWSFLQPGASGWAACKCHHDWLRNPWKYAIDPIIDAFMVAPRNVAAILMTTWSRRERIKPEIFSAWARNNACFQRRIDGDLHECLTSYDLQSHGFGLHLIPTQDYMGAWAQKRYTHVHFGQCDITKVGDVNGWFIYHFIANLLGGCAR